MREKKLVIISLVLTSFFCVNLGCNINDHQLWTIPIQATILDTYEGTVISRGTTDIEGINSTRYGQATLAGPYFDISIVDSQLIVQTNSAFRSYEEVEVASRVAITVEFNCVGGSTRGGLILWIDITDTNNNAPQFMLTADEYEFVITPPLPPGFSITGCYNDIITVRDIDLTTQRIDFSLDDSTYFEIFYDEAGSTNSKEFNAQIRTTTFIRSLNETLTLRITATDVDLTSDPALSTTIVLRIKADSEFQFPEEPVFSQTFYLANYTDDHQLILLETISLRQGFDEYVNFTLEGEYLEYFDLDRNGNEVTLIVSNPIPVNVWSERQILFIIKAEREYTSGSSATIIVQLYEGTELQFERVFYEGYIEDNNLQLSPLILSQGFDGTTVTAEVIGDFSSYFTASVQQNLVTLTMDPLISEVIEENRFISLPVLATSDHSSTYTVVNLDIIKDDNVTPVFDQTIYSGSYDPVTGLSVEQIEFVQGFDDTVTVDLLGEHANLFQIVRNGAVLTLTSSGIPSEMFSLQNILISIEASKPRTVGANAAIHIVLPADSQPGSDVTFEKVLYEGVIQDSVVNHETITLVGFSGSAVELRGDYSSQFESDLSNGEVIVSISGPLSLPENVTLVALELHAGTASSVLLLNVPNTAGPSTPTVTFSSSSYGFQMDTSQTGQVGQVHATANNGEAVTYSLLLDSALLQESLTVNAGGELYLAAPLNNGLYNFQVVATTVSTQIQGFATVHLSVEAINLCPDENAMNPLIILDVDEEEPHYDLLNGTQYGNCHFILTNRWPVDHTWVYVDENGLHTTAIDREHEYIAFMPLSQVQVEVNLHCEGDPTRIKRSLNSDALGPYDYGSNKWILTDTIIFNSRRSFVNIIVNDINDNAPIFAGKENEPIAVGYPVPELAEIILPRSLVELKATDADIGENAALLYWSSAPELAVAATTGFVHLRDVATLENGSRYAVSATDRNGQGLTGSIDILVRLLDENHIAVVTIRDAFLDDEGTVISSLSEGVGYEVKVLRSAVISDGGTDVSRIKRDVSRTGGASLQLYVYGLIAREPVSVEQLTADISNIVTAPVIIASSVSLQDHLEGQEICVIAGRDTGLLVATIVLSVFLFIVLVLIAVWFFLRWRKNRNYDEFSDVNSLSSRNVSDDNVPKPEAAPKPRLDYAELKKSERRLQEMLDAPIENVIIEPSIDSINDAILNMPEPMTPIVIQSIDKLKDPSDDSGDEYGEVDLPRRKSVVTFNENVEKIIHLEDTPDAEDLDDEPEFEIYKL